MTSVERVVEYANVQQEPALESTPGNHIRIVMTSTELVEDTDFGFVFYLQTKNLRRNGPIKAKFYSKMFICVTTLAHRSF